MIPRDAERSAPAPQFNESRACSRVQIHSLAYIELGEANAGLILNISESGIAVQAVETLSSGHFPRMQFRLPKTETPIQVAGKVVWQIKPRKEAGIEFQGLSEQTRLAIRKWIAAEESRQDASEKAHLRTLSDLPGPARQKTAVQVYPSERGDEETVAVIPDVTPAPADFAPAPADLATFERHRDTAPRDTGRISKPDTGRVSKPVPSIVPSIVPPAAPVRIPDRWRPAPSSRATQPSPILRGHNQLFGTSAWNNGITPARTGPKDRRPRWPYVAALVLLSAVGIAGVMALDPGAMSIASVSAVVDRAEASLKHNQPAPASSPTETLPADQQQLGDSSLNASTKPSSSQPSQAAPTEQTQNPTASPQNALANPQASAAATAPSSAQPGAQSSSNSAPAESSPTDVPNLPSNPGYQAQSQPAASAPSSVAPNQADHGGTAPQYPAQTQNLPPARTTQTAQSTTAQTPANPRYSQRAPRRQQADAYTPNDQRSAYTRRNAPAYSGETATDNRASQQAAPPSFQASGSQNQSAARRPQRDQSALEAWRAQTALPTAIRPPRRPPAVQQRSVQDAYANSAPYMTPRNTPPVSSSQPQTFIVDMPGYRSVAVPPSMPLSGVPSGSVAATSQFRAIWVPASLEWARQYLPGNLGVGQLLSSYSPAYPFEAAREGIEGTVKLDVTVATDGTVRSVQLISGPPMLSSAAISAVRDWRYAETFLAGEAIETQQNVTMVFRLTPTQ